MREGARRWEGKDRDPKAESKVESAPENWCLNPRREASGKMCKELAMAKWKVSGFSRDSNRTGVIERKSGRRES